MSDIVIKGRYNPFQRGEEIGVEEPIVVGVAEGVVLAVESPDSFT